MTDRRARLLYPVYYEIMENGDRAQRVQKFLKDVDHHVSFLHTNPGIATDMLNIKIVDDETKNEFIDMLRRFLLTHFNSFGKELKNILEHGTDAAGKYIDVEHHRLKDIIEALRIVRINAVEYYGGNRKNRKNRKSRKAPKRKNRQQKTRRYRKNNRSIE